MQTIIKNKLKQIRSIWTDFIIDHKYFHNKVKFSKGVEMNFCSAVLGYFDDTLDLVFAPNMPDDYNGIFVRNISLLQVLYVQQDFVEELLLVFKCGVTKGDLQKDPNYSINRDIRNELIGHPVRRTSKYELVSSTLFSYQQLKSQIQYLRFHKDNDFSSEVVTHEIEGIQRRHKEFVSTYCDIILKKSKTLLHGFAKELVKLQKTIDNHGFDAVIGAIGHIFESFYGSSHAFNPESLKYIYERKDDHFRYQHFIDRFYSDLQITLKETTEQIMELFEPRIVTEQPKVEFKIQVIEAVFNEKEISQGKPLPSYGYDIGKLSENRTTGNFDMYAKMLKCHCPQNKEILDELEHMKQNLENEAEYHSAHRLLSKLLGEG